MSTVTQIENTAVRDEYRADSKNKNTRMSGKTVGNPKLSEAGAEYYEKLKQKFSGMDFILVSEDMKETAKSQAASYAGGGKTVVLIDEAKIERMATDENYRKQYESIIENASVRLTSLQSSLSKSNSNVTSFGMQINDDGTAAYFAVIKKASDAQKERIEAKASEKAAQRKADKKAEEKKTEEKRLEEASEKRKEDPVVITANSIEELLNKIKDYEFEQMSNSVQTEEEKNIGQHIDFRG